MQGRGSLAIWSDIDAANETDYLHWLTREHVEERVGVEGFLNGRVFRSIAPELHRYFILYELAAPDVVASESYLARLNAPTPWSQRIMPLLGNFFRGGGRITAQAGFGWGGAIAAIRMHEGATGGLDTKALRDIVGRVAESDRIASARLLEVDTSATTIPTREKSLRKADDPFRALLIVEGLDVGSVQAALASLDASLWQGHGEVQFFTAVFAFRDGETP